MSIVFWRAFAAAAAVALLGLALALGLAGGALLGGLELALLARDLARLLGRCHVVETAGGRRVETGSRRGLDRPPGAPPPAGP